MNKCELLLREFEFVQWNDNLSEMKHFCGSKCKITYETCSIDDYFHLQVKDILTGDWVSVPLHDVVLKIENDRFAVIGAEDFKTYFDVLG